MRIPTSIPLKSESLSRLANATTALRLGLPMMQWDPSASLSRGFVLSVLMKSQLLCRAYRCGQLLGASPV